MAAPTDVNSKFQPPAFVKLSRQGVTHRVLLAQEHVVAPDLTGQWFCDIERADGVRCTRVINFPRGGVNETLRDVVASLQEAKPSMRRRYISPDSNSDDVKRISYSFWTPQDDLSQSDDVKKPYTSPNDSKPRGIYVLEERDRRYIIGLYSETGSTINNIFSGEYYDFEFVSTPEGHLPTLRHVPRWDLADTYWSFMHSGNNDAAETTGSILLRELDKTTTSEISDRHLFVAAHATLRFPWLQEHDGKLDKILAIKSKNLLDLQVLEWARSFDRDPAEDDVFDWKLSNLLERLRREPPAYSATVQVLMERLRTAVVERENLKEMKDEAAWDVVRIVRAFAAAALPGRDYLIFEGASPLAPKYLMTGKAANHRSFSRSHEGSSFGM